MEIRIPLNVLGLPNNINYYGVQIPMSIKTGPYVGNGKTLTLSNIDWFATGYGSGGDVNAPYGCNR